MLSLTIRGVVRSFCSEGILEQMASPGRELKFTSLKRIVPREKRAARTIESPGVPASDESSEQTSVPTSGLTAELASPIEQTLPVKHRRRRRDKIQASTQVAQQRIIRIRCSNCRTVFQFKTSVDMVYKCRECSEVIHVRIKTRRTRILLFAFLGLAVAVAGVLIANYISGSVS